uniref:Uncharacterized protein n=1 Tax=Nelumbo nucifera TaxID=4432 RepID=A0A822YF52_NELNU|nr:TPA_asm: hypothetical protein HUJ06_029626 [Nelumbo nucifera]
MSLSARMRICPGLGLALLHLENIVANLMRDIERTVVDGDEADLFKKLELTVVTNNSLRPHTSPKMK